MFSFRLKNTNINIEIYVTRALFAIAAVAAYVYTGNVYVRYGSVILLLAVAVFTKTILKRYKVNQLILLGAGAVVTLLTSGSVVFAVVLIIYGFFLKVMSKKTKLDIHAEMIIVKYALYSRVYKWADMSNVVLKDGILTLDFKSNKIFQSEVEENETPVDEKEFNRFCTEQIQNCLSFYQAVNNNKDQ